jgi:ESCRT-II complex subunit VPS22
MPRSSQVIDTFRTHLEEFARKYKTQIRSDPVFRAQFQIMCEKVGVDPLASSKGLWGELLGLGDYYYELGVRIVEVGLLNYLVHTRR